MLPEAAPAEKEGLPSQGAVELTAQASATTSKSKQWEKRIRRRPGDSLGRGWRAWCACAGEGLPPLLSTTSSRRSPASAGPGGWRSEEHTSELQSQFHLP